VLKQLGLKSPTTKEITMYLTADTINGVTELKSLPIKGLKFLEQEDFYSALSTLKDNEQIATCASLKMAKKIHKEFGIHK
jgi:hypothetical protein